MNFKIECEHEHIDLQYSLVRYFLLSTDVIQIRASMGEFVHRTSTYSHVIAGIQDMAELSVTHVRSSASFCSVFYEI